MLQSRSRWLWVSTVLGALGVAAMWPVGAESACGMRWPSRPIIIDNTQPPPKPEMVQPSQIAFLTFDEKSKTETFCVQPRFEGNVEDFGMLIPSPSKPTIDEMPRDLFKALGVFTTPVRRMLPASRMLLERDTARNPRPGRGGWDLEMQRLKSADAKENGGGGAIVGPRPSTVAVLGVGHVSGMNYKILKAGRADDLHTWLKDNKYNTGDEAVLDYYVKKKWVFTVMKIDTAQMKKNPDGSFVGDIAPMRFTFSSNELVYPLKITQDSVKDGTDATFYVASNSKVDLADKFTYQHDWTNKLRQAKPAFGNRELPGGADEWFKVVKEMHKEAQKLEKDASAAQLLWAKKLTAEDIKVLAGDLPYSETVPNPDDGFSRADLGKDAAAIYRVIERRLAKFNKDRPNGYAQREAPAEDVKAMKLLVGHLKEGMVLTKIRKKFAKTEMEQDLQFVQAKVDGVADKSDYCELLQPPQPVLRTVWTGGWDDGMNWKRPRLDPNVMNRLLDAQDQAKKQ